MAVMALMCAGLEAFGKEAIVGSGSGAGDTASSAVEWVDLGLPSGLLWASCNLGASKPEEYGDYYAWGETKPRIQDRSWDAYRHANGDKNRLTKYCNDAAHGNNGFTDRLLTLQSVDDAATQQLGNGARMPTWAEWQELWDNTDAIWTMQNGVNGYKFIGRNGKSIFLPAAGYPIGPWSKWAGTKGYYWSASLYEESHPSVAWLFEFDEDSVYDVALERIGVRSVRPVRSARSGNVQPTKTTTTTNSSSSKAPSQNYTSSYTNQTRSGTTTTHSSVSTKQTVPKWKRWPYYYISPVFGLSASYAERALHVSGGDLDQPIDVDYFVDEEAMRGFRIGIDIFPSESWDMGLFGIHTGLFYEMYFCSWDSVPSNDYYDRYFEGSLSVPLDLTFTIPFGKHSGLQLYGGLVADVTLFNQLYFSKDSFSEPNKNLFGTNYLKRFNLAYEYGVTLHLKGVMLHASLQTGLTRHPTFEGYATSVNKFTVGLSRVF